MQVNLSNINIDTVIMLSLAILLGYLGISVFKLIGRVISIALGILLLTYVLQQVGVTIPVLTNIINYFISAIHPVIDTVKNVTSIIRSK